jgi:hypothetical protein
MYVLTALLNIWAHPLLPWPVRGQWQSRAGLLVHNEPVVGAWLEQYVCEQGGVLPDAGWTGMFRRRSWPPCWPTGSRCSP